MSEALAAEARAIPIATLFRPAPLAGPGLEALLAEREAAGAARGKAEAEARLRKKDIEQAGARQALLARHAAELASQAEAARAAIFTLETALAEALGSLAAEFARAVLRAEPAASAETLQSLADEALANVPPGSLGALCLHPEAAPQLAACLPAGWRIEPDAAIPPGTVRAQVDGATVTASLALRITQLSAHLAGDRA